MSAYALAQLNIGIAREPLDSPAMKDFVDNLERINALAESAPGFVWRLKTADGDATALRPIDAQTLVNMSVWENVAALNEFVYKTAHVEIMRRRREWFTRMPEAFVVLWWVARGHEPTTDEALERLDHLRAHGPTPTAFTFRQAFAAPDAPTSPRSFGNECPA